MAAQVDLTREHTRVLGPALWHSLASAVARKDKAEGALLAAHYAWLVFCIPTPVVGRWAGRQYQNPS
jgi:hypothetical protein